MRIAIGSDHAGFELKESLRGFIGDLRHDAMDLGTNSTEPVDYPDVSAAAGRAVLEGRADRAIIICGSGAGACVAANKLRGIRAAVAHETYTAHQMVEHDDVNVLCLGARVVGTHVAVEVVAAFLNATFSHEERHRRRVAKVNELDTR